MMMLTTYKAAHVKLNYKKASSATPLSIIVTRPTFTYRMHAAHKLGSSQPRSNPSCIFNLQAIQTPLVFMCRPSKPLLYFYFAGHPNPSRICLQAIQTPHVYICRPSKPLMYLFAGHPNPSHIYLQAIQTPHVFICRPSKPLTYLFAGHPNPSCTYLQAIQLSQAEGQHNYAARLRLEDEDRVKKAIELSTQQVTTAKEWLLLELRKL